MIIPFYEEVKNDNKNLTEAYAYWNQKLFTGIIFPNGKYFDMKGGHRFDSVGTTFSSYRFDGFLQMNFLKNILENFGLLLKWIQITQNTKTNHS